MSDEGDTMEKETPEETPSSKETEPQTPEQPVGDDDTSPGKEDDEIQVPKYRFDEERAKRKELEMEFANYKSETSHKFESLSQALSGKSKEDVDDVVSKLSKSYGVDEKFIGDMLEAAEARAYKKFQEDLKPLKTQQAQAAFNAELNQLYKEFPEAADMSKEELTEFRKMAVDKKYQMTPLADLWKIRNFGKPSGKSKTAESSRGGSREFDDGEVDISKMSLEEFEKFSEGLAKK